MKNFCPNSSIKKCFSEAALTYDEYAEVQQRIAKETFQLVEQYFGKTDSSILEIGSGTGALTEELTNCFPEASIDAVEISSGMIEEAKYLNSSTNINWIESDILNFQTDKKYSLITSSSALHWARPFSSVSKKLSQFIAPQGILICSVMLSGTLGELREARHRVSPSKLPLAGLPTAENIKNPLIRDGFSFVEEKLADYKIEYPSAADFLSSIKAQGLTGGAFSMGKEPLSRLELKQLMNDYEDNYQTDSGCYASYKVLYFVAKRDG